MRIIYLKDIFNRKVINNTVTEMKKNRSDFSDFVIKKTVKDAFGKEVIKFHHRIRNSVDLIRQRAKHVENNLKDIEGNIERLQRNIRCYRTYKQTQNKVTKKEYNLIQELDEITKRKPQCIKKKQKNIGSQPFAFQSTLITNELI